MRKLTGLLVALLTFCALLTGLAPATASSQAEAAISAAYNRPGVAAALGSSVSAVTCGLKDNGCYQTFQNGAINWTPNTGAKITKAGAIRSYWASQNYENGRFGYPVTDEICGQTAGGCYQDFQGGSILWSPTTGAQPSTPGAIRTTWAQTGYHGGPLGYPTNAETCGLKDNGCYQTFQNGAINWTPNTGA
ncbi:LGFP repeat-containing protein, partial [Arthrobacter russicus]|uniref:LGFP repeat-containing protein n=1 Tax=Arthrobacter russicus TaxID=172040 RepID=UPI003CEB532A